LGDHKTFIAINIAYQQLCYYGNLDIFSSMTLTTHAVVGAAIAASMPNHPILGFTLAFASHFVLDVIPHWDYPLLSYTRDNGNRLNDDMILNKNFLVDLSRIGLDMFSGILLVLVFFTLTSPHLFWIPFIGVCGAVIPDALQFAYWKCRREPLTTLQRFHIWVDPEKGLHDKPLIGIPFQIAVIVLVIFISKLG